MNMENEIEIKGFINYIKSNFKLFLLISILSIVISILYSFYIDKRYSFISEISVKSEFLEKIQSSKNRFQDNASPNLIMINNSWENLFSSQNIEIIRLYNFYYFNITGQSLLKVPTNYIVKIYSSNSEKIFDDFTNEIKAFETELKNSLILSYSDILEKIQIEIEETKQKTNLLDNMVSYYNTQIDELTLDNTDSKQNLFAIYALMQTVFQDKLEVDKTLNKIEKDFDYISSFLDEIKGNNYTMYKIEINDTIIQELNIIRNLIFFLIIGFVVSFVITFIRYL